MRNTYGTIYFYQKQSAEFDDVAVLRPRAERIWFCGDQEAGNQPVLAWMAD